MATTTHKSRLLTLPRELREKVWFWLFADEWPSHDSVDNSLTDYPLTILRISHALRSEALPALRNHFTTKTICYGEMHPPQEMKEEETDIESDKIHIRFLQQYGECFKKVFIYWVEYSMDPLGIGHFPYLEVLEFGASVDFKLEKSQILVDDQVNSELLAKVWLAWYQNQVDEDGQVCNFDELSEEYARVMAIKKGEQRSFSIYVNLYVHIKGLETKCVLFDIDEKKIVEGA